jgi:hypothetical protein
LHLHGNKMIVTANLQRDGKPRGHRLLVSRRTS